MSEIETKLNKKDLECLLRMIRNYDKINNLSVIVNVICILSLIFSIIMALIVKSYSNLILGLVFTFISEIVHLILKIYNIKSFESLVKYLNDRNEVIEKIFLTNMIEIREVIESIYKISNVIEKNKREEKNNNKALEEIRKSRKKKKKRRNRDSDNNLEEFLNNMK